jgi:hypothetical protein
MRLMGTNEWRKIWGKLEAAARCTALVLRPEARLRRSGALMEGVMTWVRRWAERGANMEHDRGESCTGGKAEVVSTEATGRRNSMKEGEHEAKHEEEGEEVCEDGGGSGNITIGVGEDGTRRYAEGESRTGESEDAGCRVNSSTEQGRNKCGDAGGSLASIDEGGENEGVGEGGEEGERRGRPRTLGGGRRNSH